VVFPADFCELGVERFLADLDRFPSIRGDILKSLERAALDKGDWRLVYPSSVRLTLTAESGCALIA